MRLLNVNTRQLEEFFGDAIPPYAILSHTWGQEEVLLQDLARKGHQQKQGYAKIEGCCQQAIKDGLSWVWVDTCCIDKTSSAELSEAINSMFHWYKNSQLCYAYLQDVPSGSDIYEKDSDFRKSRWFTRGWTLQELLAPRRIGFYDTHWMLISQINTNDRRDRTNDRCIELLSDITSIPERFISHQRTLVAANAALKFSWMARRRTTRVEDEAYCLLGLLDINMPLLYGEGDKAFVRLQEAVLGGLDDISPLAWGYNLPCSDNESYLARSPASFLGYPQENMGNRRRAPIRHTTVTGLGLHIELSMIPIHALDGIWVGLIEENIGGHRSHTGLVLRQQHGNLFLRASGCTPIPLERRNIYEHLVRNSRRKQIYITYRNWNGSDTGEDSIWKRLLSDIRLPRAWRRLLPDIRLPRAWRHSRFSPQIRVRVPFLYEMGCSFSDSWPPVYFSRASGSMELVCYGPHSHVFYMIFLHEDQGRLAVKVNVRWGNEWPKSVETAFSRLSDQYSHTALEHCCGSKIGSKVPQFAKNIHWTPYLAVVNAATDERGHVVGVSERYGLDWLEGCELVWKKGPHPEEGSTSASHTAGK